MIRRFLFFIFLVFSFDFGYAQIKILFVGNSYTYYNEMPSLVQKIAEANNQKVEVTMSVNGGVSLRDHWNENLGLVTKQMLIDNEYDFVVLQDQTMTPIQDPKATLEFGGKLASLVQNKSGQLVVYQTWSRENNPDSQKQLNEIFEKLKINTNGILAPVANAWHLARNEYPNLPLYDSDGSHPSELGSYLAALVFYLTLFEQEITTFKTFEWDKWPMSSLQQCEWLAIQVTQKEK